MDFRIKFNIEEAENKIDHHSNLLLIGSCFVENIGNKFEWFRYKNLQNPIGILFHPAVIEKFISRVAKDQEYSEEDIFEYNSKWQSYEAHSKVSAKTQKECLQKLNDAFSQTKHSVSKASHVILSLGTAWYYELKKNQQIVANCHKVPQQNFDKKLATTAEIEQSLQNTADLLRELNPHLEIILTVSPIRHLKDGIVQNTLSKSNLITAVHKVVSENSYISYFPSFEIMMDELRDYRFYAEDMIHPSSVAIEYIWERFSSIWISPESAAIFPDIDTIQKARHHRLSEEYTSLNKKFLTKLQLKIEEIQKKHPEITFS